MPEITNTTEATESTSDTPLVKTAAKPVREPSTRVMRCECAL